MREVYLDAAASYPPTISVQNYIGNPHSIHMLGSESKTAIKKAEDLLRERLGVRGGTFHWVGSGSEANRLVLSQMNWGIYTALATAIEHKSILQNFHSSAARAPATPEGCVNFPELCKLIDKNTGLISVQLANNETGAINIDPQLARDLYDPEIMFHSDLAQAFCKMSIEGYGFDLVTLSAHKIGGPKGLGCLWVREGLDITYPYLGTPNPGAIEAFGLAARDFPDLYTYNDMMVELASEFWRYLDVQARPNPGSEHPKLPGIINLTFLHPLIDATELMLQLTTKGIHVSLGSACNNRLHSRSHVLQAMGLPDEEIDSTIRISFHHHLTTADVRYAADVINETVKEIRSGS